VAIAIIKPRIRRRRPMRVLSVVSFRAVGSAMKILECKTSDWATSASVPPSFTRANRTFRLGETSASWANDSPSSFITVAI
jgi:hypothetical protein